MKDFDTWNKLKQSLDADPRPPSFSEREIWWCSIGVNVGFEVYGKDSTFSRPVLILRKYSRFTFLGVPLTSKQKNNPLYFPFPFDGKQGSIMLDQVRTLDGRRLTRRMGKITEKQAETIKQAIKGLL